MKRSSLSVSTLPGLLALALLGCGASPATGTATSSPAAPSQPTPAAPSATPQATSPAAQSGSLDVCALATQSEIDAAAGVSLGPPTPQPPPNPGSAKCSWTGSGAPVGGLFEPGITISAITLPTGTPVSSIPPFNGQPPSARHISGLGDVAVSLAPGQLGPTSVEIFVAKRGSVITLALVNSGAPHTADPVQSMTTLAQAVVGRFP